MIEVTKVEEMGLDFSAEAEAQFKSTVYASIKEYFSDMMRLGFNSDSIAVHSLELVEAKERLKSHEDNGGSSLFDLS